MIPVEIDFLVQNKDQQSSLAFSKHSGNDVLNGENQLELSEHEEQLEDEESVLIWLLSF